MIICTGRIRFVLAVACLLCSGNSAVASYSGYSVSCDPADQIESFQSGTEPSVTCQYDQKGNMKAGLGNLTVNYDYENRPTEIEKNEIVINYSYNGLGDRVVRQVDSECSREILDYGNRLKNTLMDKTREGVPHRYYLWGVGLIGHVDVNPDTGKETVVYYHGNEVGSTLALTDEEGQVTDTYAYTPYGEVSTHGGTTETSYLYNGGLGVRHEGDGIYHMKARYYSAKLKRFLSRDPLGLDGGHNLYAFADGNPIFFMDPFGLCAESYAKAHWDRQYRFWGFGENDVTYDDIQFAIGAADNQSASGLNLGTRAFGLAETTLGLAATVYGAGNVSAGVATFPVGGPVSLSVAAGGAFVTTWGVAHTDAGMKKLFTGQWHDSLLTRTFDYFLDDMEEARLCDFSIGLQGLVYSANMNSQLSLPRSQAGNDVEGRLKLDGSYTDVANKNASGVRVAGTLGKKGVPHKGGTVPPGLKVSKMKDGSYALTKAPKYDPYYEAPIYKKAVKLTKANRPLDEMVTAREVAGMARGNVSNKIKELNKILKGNPENYWELYNKREKLVGYRKVLIMTEDLLDDHIAEVGYYNNYINKFGKSINPMPDGKAMAVDQYIERNKFRYDTFDPFLDME